MNYQYNRHVNITIGNIKNCVIILMFIFKNKFHPVVFEAEHITSRCGAGKVLLLVSQKSFSWRRTRICFWNKGSVEILRSHPFNLKWCVWLWEFSESEKISLPPLRKQIFTKSCWDTIFFCKKSFFYCRHRVLAGCHSRNCVWAKLLARFFPQNHSPLQFLS